MMVAAGMRRSLEQPTGEKLMTNPKGLTNTMLRAPRQRHAKRFSPGLLVLVIGIALLSASPAVASATTLPDGRAYELVSPPDKNGSDVSGDPTKTRPALDGDAVSFASVGAFADARGTGLTTQYVSQRDGRPGTNGWSTHAITPKQGTISAIAVGNDLAPLYAGEFSDDLSKGIVSSYDQLAPGPNVQAFANLYLRTDLRSPGPGGYQLLSDAFAPASVETLAALKPSFADASTDFTHVIFESTVPLTPDAPADQSVSKLYEWDNGTVRLVGILPDGTPAPASFAGQGTGVGGALTYTPNTISDDGTRIFFTDPSSGTDIVDGNVYMRVDHSSTVQLNASEKDTPDSPAPATYQWATPDGLKVFFTSGEQLTNTPGGGLYLYDASKPDSDPHNLTLLSVDTEPSDGTGAVMDGVAGASRDGSYVYFLAHGQLVAGKPATTGAGIYLWHDGTVSYIGQLDNGNDVAGMRGSNWKLVVKSSRVTPSGRFFLFSSRSGVGLTGYDHGSCGHGAGCTELYLYDADAATLKCISCAPGSGPAVSAASATLDIHEGAAGLATHLNRPLSDDGRYVFFSTGEALSPADHNGAVRDVYEYNVVTGKTVLISDGRGTSASFFMDATPTGDNVFFTTRDRNVGWDIDDNYDLYDARVHGGFPEPVAPRVCSGDACQGALGVAPSVGVPGTQLLNGAGNLSPPVVRKPVVKRVSNAQRLSRALKACKQKPRRARKKCESQARKRFGHKSGGSR